MLAKLLSKVFSELAHSFLFPAVTEIALGSADGSQRQGDEPVDETIGAQRELERAASDVHHHRAANGQIEMRERPTEGEACLALPPQVFGLEPGFGTVR